jgi:hypothetical protein
MTSSEDNDDRWRQLPPSLPEIKCPICGHKPMAPLDPNARWTTLSLIKEDRKDFFIDTHVFICERCRNIQAFMKGEPEK